MFVFDQTLRPAGSCSTLLELGTEHISRHEPSAIGWLGAFNIEHDRIQAEREGGPALVHLTSPAGPTMRFLAVRVSAHPRYDPDPRETQDPDRPPCPPHPCRRATDSQDQSAPRSAERSISGIP